MRKNLINATNEAFCFKNSAKGLKKISLIGLYGNYLLNCDQS